MPRSVIACGGRPVMSSPSNSTSPLVGLYTPVSMLKNVVLPAPFGPIKLMVESRGIVKSTSSTASKPPNSFRSCAVTRMLSPTLTSGLLVLNGRVVHAGLEFELPPLLGEESLRSQQHHEHNDRSVDPVRHERRVEAAAAVSSSRIAIHARPSRESRRRTLQKIVMSNNASAVQNISVTKLTYVPCSRR